MAEAVGATPQPVNPTMADAGRQKGILRRALRNTGLLLSGKVGSALMQLATLALAARGLGLVEFGLLSMLLAQVQLLTGLAAFQSNQATVRYGVRHIETGNAAAFQALAKAGTLLDLGAALVAMIAALALAPVLGDYLHWDARVIFAAQLIAPYSFANAISTPRGMLRIFGRFDLITKQMLITPALGLVGVLAAFLLHASLEAYLLAWLVSGLIGGAAGLWLGWREAARRGLLTGINGSLRGLSRENEGIWYFSLITNLYSSVSLIPGHLSTFLVGAVLGPAEAGLFKVAREVGAALSRPVLLLNQTVYPDVARLVVAREWDRLKRVFVRAGALAVAVNGAATLLIVLVGKWLILSLFGPAYLPGLPVLIMISAATTLSVSMFATEPVMHGLGRPTRPLVIAVLANLAFLALLLWRLPLDGLIGAGWAYVVSSLITTVLSFALVWTTWKSLQRSAP